jgi:hypothetical protein
MIGSRQRAGWRCNLPSYRWMAVWVWAAMLGLSPPATARAEGKVHLLLAGDVSDDGGIAESVKRDEEGMCKSFKANLPESLLEIHTILGDEFRPQIIRDKIQSLNVTGADIIVFFYSGHGAWDPRSGHYLAFTKDAPLHPELRLFRSELREELLGKKSQLVLIITDCCAVYAAVKAGGRPVQFAAERPAMITPRFRSLIYDQKGIVDITSSKPGEYSHGDNGGGLFSSSLVRYLGDKRYQNRKLTWAELMIQATKEVDRGWRERYPDGKLPFPPGGTQETQTPHIFTAPTLIFGVRAMRDEGLSEGVRVTEVVRGAPGEEAGVEVGDVILKINGQPVRDDDEYVRLLDQAKRDGRLVVVFRKKDGGRPLKKHILLQK